MKTKSREELEEDLREVESLMSEINRNQNRNYRVIERNYLEPRTIAIKMPMNHPQGLFMYHKEISDTLRIALGRGVSRRSSLELVV